MQGKDNVIELLQSKYPHVAACLEEVTNLVRAIDRRKNPQFCELEARIGVVSYTDGFRPRFDSGADMSFVSRVLCKLETSDAWTSKSEWTQQVDRFYLLPSGLQARTTTETVPGELPDAPRAVVTHIIKSDVGHVDLKWECGNVKTLHTSDDGDVYNVRVSLKQEDPVFEDELQDRVDDLHVVRLKQRKTFQYTPPHTDRVMWNVDVTQLYQAPTFVEAVAALREGTIHRYELEVECQNPYEHLRQNGFNHAMLAASLLLKATDMFEVGNGKALHASTNRLVPVRA